MSDLPDPPLNYTQINLFKKQPLLQQIPINASVNALPLTVNPDVAPKGWLFYLTEVLVTTNPVASQIRAILEKLLGVPASAVTSAFIAKQASNLLAIESPYISNVLISSFFKYFKSIKLEDKKEEADIFTAELNVYHIVKANSLAIQPSCMTAMITNAIKASSHYSQLLKQIELNLKATQLYQHDISGDFSLHSLKECLRFNLFNDCKENNCENIHRCVSCHGPHPVFDKDCKGSNNDQAIKRRLAKSNEYRSNLGNNKESKYRQKFNNQYKSKYNGYYNQYQQAHRNMQLGYNNFASPINAYNQQSPYTQQNPYNMPYNQNSQPTNNMAMMPVLLPNNLSVAPRGKKKK